MVQYQWKEIEMLACHDEIDSHLCIFVTNLAAHDVIALRVDVAGIDDGCEKSRSPNCPINLEAVMPRWLPRTTAHVLSKCGFRTKYIGKGRVQTRGTSDSVCST